MDINTQAGQLIAKLNATSPAPEWAERLRQQSLPAALAALPALNKETGISWADIVPLAPEKSPAVDPAPALGDASSVLLSSDGDLAAQRLCQEAERGEVIFSPWHAAVRTHSNLLNRFAGKILDPQTDPVAAMCFAFCNGGTFIYVPAGMELTVPLHVVNRFSPGTHGAFLHTVIVAEERAAVSVVESQSSEDSMLRTHWHAVEIHAAAGARVQYATVQNWGDASVCFSTVKAWVGQAAQVELVAGTIGGSKVTDKTDVVLAQTGSQCSSLVLYAAAQEQRVHITSNITHVAERTSSDMLTRGVVGAAAQVLQHECTSIGALAANSSAYMRSHALMLSSNSRVDAIPALEIHQHEVQAGHAVTTSMVDENHLFYLMSRGLTRRKATSIIVEGFFMPIMQRIPLDEARRQLQTLIDRKMDQWM